MVMDNPSRKAARTSALRLSRGRRERRKADIRRRLFDAAVKLFASRGYNATTVEEITCAADVAKGTFFNYFPTKEFLLTDFVERRLDIVRAAHRQASEGGHSLREILRRLLKTMMAEPGRSPAMSRCMMQCALNGGPIQGWTQQLMKTGQHLLGEVMAMGQRRGEIRADWAPAELGRLFQQSFYGVMYLWALHPNLNLTRCLDETFALFWAGIEAPGGPAKNSRKGT